MNNFLQYNPTKLFFGEGQIEQVSSQIEKGLTILVVYGGGSIKRNGVFDAVMKQLDQAEATVHELSGVEPNPRLTTVQRGVNLCKENDVDLVLAVGGGSVIDCTKAIAAGAVILGT